MISTVYLIKYIEIKLYTEILTGVIQIFFPVLNSGDKGPFFREDKLDCPLLKYHYILTQSLFIFSSNLAVDIFLLVVYPHSYKPSWLKAMRKLVIAGKYLIFMPQQPIKCNFSFQFIASYMWHSMENLASDLLFGLTSKYKFSQHSPHILLRRERVHYWQSLITSVPISDICKAAIPHSIGHAV